MSTETFAAARSLTFTMLLALVVLLLNVAVSDPAFLPGFVPVDAPATKNQHRAIGFDPVFVCAVDDHLIVSRTPIGGRRLLVPPQFSPAFRNNLVAVAPVRHGWLAGYNAGEFGGGLWLVGRRGDRAVRVQFSKTRQPDDPYAAENVVALVQSGGHLLVLVGSDHLLGRSGRVFEVTCRRNQCETRLVALLDGCPRDWVALRDRLIILTRGGIWELTAAERVEKVYEFHYPEWVQPTSIAQLSTGVLYVGMDHYVLRLSRRDGEWTDDLYEAVGDARSRD